MIAQSESVKALLGRLNGLSANLEPAAPTAAAFEHPMVKPKGGHDMLSGKTGIPPA